MSFLFEIKDLKKDIKNPMIICKCIGETLNKSLSKSLDFLVFFPSVVAVVMKSAGTNIIGVDQRGEIVFDFSYDNSYAPLLLIGIGLFFSTLLSLWKGLAQNETEIKVHFGINLVGITVFLSGFIALACYLTFPAEFQISSWVE